MGVCGAFAGSDGCTLGLAVLKCWNLNCEFHSDCLLPGYLALHEIKIITTYLQRGLNSRGIPGPVHKLPTYQDF